MFSLQSVWRCLSSFCLRQRQQSTGKATSLLKYGVRNLNFMGTNYVAWPRQIMKCETVLRKVDQEQTIAHIYVSQAMQSKSLPSHEKHHGGDNRSQENDAAKNAQGYDASCNTVIINCVTLSRANKM